MAAAKPKPEDAKPRPAPSGEPRQARATKAPSRVAAKAQPKAPSKAERAEVKGAAEEAKRRFREALERKRSQQGDHGAGFAGPDSSKIHGAQGPAFSRRTFRRKSGG
jgi:Family of unknown function (DUF5302)